MVPCIYKSSNGWSNLERCNWSVFIFTAVLFAIREIYHSLSHSSLDGVFGLFSPPPIFGMYCHECFYTLLGSCVQMFTQSIQVGIELLGHKVWDWGFPSGSAVKNLPANIRDAGDMGLIPGWGRSPGGGNSNPFQYSCWEIPWTEEPGGLQSMGSQRVGHNTHTPKVWGYSALRDNAKLFSKMEPWILLPEMYEK